MKLLNLIRAHYLLLILFVIGIYLRLSGTLGGFFAFTFDQGRDFLVWHEMVTVNKIGLIGPSSGIEGVFHGVWWYWLLFPIFVITRGNPTWMVAGFNIVSAFIVPLMYALGLKLRGKTLGIILAAFAAFSQQLIAIGAQIWNPNVAPLFVSLFLLSLLGYFKKKQGFFWVGFWLGGLFEFGIGFGALFTVSVITSFLSTRVKINTRSVIAGVLGFGIWALPRILFELRHNFQQLRSLAQYIQGPSVYDTDPLRMRFIQRYETLRDLFSDSFATGNTWVAIIILGAVLMGLGLFYRSEHDALVKKFMTFLISTLAVFFAISVLYPAPLWSYYMVGLSALFLPIGAIALYAAFQKHPKPMLLVGLLIVVMYCISVVRLLRGSDWEGDQSVYKNQLRVVDAIFTDSQGEVFNAPVYTPVVRDYTYQYLFLWRGNSRYGFTPDRDAVTSLAYFILEPEENFGMHAKIREAWLRDREGDGEVVWEKTFPGNILVQKRRRDLD
ncbi:hypothetical protein C4564_02210 [Candidatus Microgenomates bacterium]|nr:MAG: hypothetical protein C4564_02210 [Candidatus Microgenomates bacterium]